MTTTQIIITGLLVWAIVATVASLVLGRAMRHASRDDYRDEQEDRR